MQYFLANIQVTFGFHCVWIFVAFEIWCVPFEIVRGEGVLIFQPITNAISFQRPIKSKRGIFNFHMSVCSSQRAKKAFIIFKKFRFLNNYCCRNYFINWNGSKSSRRPFETVVWWSSKQINDCQGKVNENAMFIFSFRPFYTVCYIVGQRLSCRSCAIPW